MDMNCEVGDMYMNCGPCHMVQLLLVVNLRVRWHVLILDHINLTFHNETILHLPFPKVEVCAM